MKLLSAKSRITIGLACMVFSVLCTAMMIGLVPDERAGILDGRAKTCESIAITSSDFISRGELRRLEFFLQSAVDRNDDILSAGVRRDNGKLITEIGEHRGLWESDKNERSTATHVHVPIRAGQESWGDVELRFREVGKPGLVGWLQSPWVCLTGFVTGVSYLLFFMYLSKMLRHLDPGKAVPKRVRAALDSLAEGLLVMDHQERIVLANQAFAAWVNRSPEKLAGVKASTLAWCGSDDSAAPASFPWQEAIRQEKAQAGIMLGLQSKEEATRMLMANASPVLGHDGKYRGVLVSFDDVTQLEETKKDLGVAKREAEEANQAKSEFLARMSHEIRTPMNAILGYTDVLRRGFDESIENRQQYLDTIHGSGEHLLALINDILDLSKVESGQMELELERCSPHKLIAQVVSLLRSKADEKGIALDFKFDELLPETILADSVRLRQTVMNLAGNAIKFTDQGGVTIAARLVDKRGQNVLAIDVIDTGIGIPKSAQEKIFQPFAQADSSVTRRFGGTGLGLAISRQLAEAMGGGVEIKSVEGQGSTFTVTLDPGPLEGIDMVDGKAALESQSENRSTAKEVAQLPPSRILVADDGPSNRKLVELVLRRAGADVVTVENGQQAVDVATSETFDLILMDMQMPVMDGYTATATLREAGCTLPIIAFTAHAMRGDEDKCQSAGCTGFLTKPIDIDRLISTLYQILTSDKSAEPASDEQPAQAVEETGNDKPRFEKNDDPTSDNSTVDQPVCEPIDVAAAAQQPAESCAGLETDSEDAADEEDRLVEQLADDVSQLAGDADAASRRQSLAADSSQAAESSPPEEPVHCSLPVDDPEFLEIARTYVSRLHQKLGEMRAVLRQGDFDSLATLAHWLKGSGGTAGFGVFTEPAAKLEQLAKYGQRESVESQLEALVAIAGRIELPGDPGQQAASTVSDCLTSMPEAPAQMEGQACAGDVNPRSSSSPSGEPLQSSLPMDDEDFRDIVQQFVETLHAKIDAMQQAASAGDVQEVARLAHWLKGSGGTAGFDAFTDMARQLESWAKSGERDKLPSAIEEIRVVASRIVISAIH